MRSQSSVKNKVIFAYEPLWAIGTGKVATNKNIEEVHSFIKHLIKDDFKVINTILSSAKKIKTEIMTRNARISKKPIMNANKKLVPLENYGIKLMSIGFILDSEAPTIWRGPMVMKALEQMFNGVEWGELDYLIIDLPPGTGDAQLTLAQSSKLSGSIIISTPQDVALTLSLIHI